MLTKLGSTQLLAIKINSDGEIQSVQYRYISYFRHVLKKENIFLLPFTKIHEIELVFNLH